MDRMVYGKAMENIENRINLRLVMNEKDLKIDIKANLYGQKICKREVTLAINKPAYFWTCVLGLSKVLMYEFYYDDIKNKYGNDSRLLFTDTDILINDLNKARKNV